MGWYQVIKAIKGHRYLYAQRTWREGKHVRTESRYIGPVADENAPASAASSPPPSSNGDVTTTPRVFYHGCRERLAGPLEPSDSGTFGPGFYLTTPERAALYAQYGPRIAAKIAAGEEGGLGAPEHEGTVYAFDVGHLNLKVLTWDAYLDQCEELSGEISAATQAARLKFQEILVSQSFDGLDIRDQGRTELVIFPASLHKLKVLET